ncbi:amidohydrolase [Jongsikchunia kroppenstedtii]|uniref:amidohydrolase n=1 Tax=Jongsikchunia kroppenstedtii TaxID=1121721 RepID=UPI00035D5E9D|nr:amidohydrolase [Jongsikchunia kroppenstedtii]
MTIDLDAVYTDLHRHPELSFAEHRTAGIVADHLRQLGIETTEGVGRTGVVGVISNGDGPTVLLRADMDALPVTETTGKPYASETPGVMHACGHDVHVTCLLGAAEQLMAARSEWSGTLLLVFQPAEEVGSGADAMVADGLYDRFPKPDIVLGQHVCPLPAGMIGVRGGPAMAAADDINVVLHGSGGHGSRPESTIDPVVMAAATVMRLQTIVSREVPGSDAAVVTVGTLQAGSKNNIIPSEARLGLNVRTFDEGIRERIVSSIRRIINAEAQASGAPEPDIEMANGFAVTVNDPEATEKTVAALRTVVGDDKVIDPGPVTGSEDVGALATAAGVPLVYWLLGGEDPAKFAAVVTDSLMDKTIPANHSPDYAPLPDPTLGLGVRALVAAARTWLG